MRTFNPPDASVTHTTSVVFATDGVGPGDDGEGDGDVALGLGDDGVGVAWLFPWHAVNKPSAIRMPATVWLRLAAA